APVILALRMYEGVAVDLRRGGEQEARAFGACDAQGVVGAEGADLERLNRQFQVVERGRGTREVQDPIERGVEADMIGDVVLDEQEASAVADVLEVVGRAGDEVVHADHLRAVSEQALAKVAADEAGGAREEYPHRG